MAEPVAVYGIFQGDTDICNNIKGNLGIFNKYTFFKVIERNSFSTTASISAQPRWLYWYWWVAEVFHTPQCAVIWSHDKASKNGTG